MTFNDVDLCLKMRRAGYLRCLHAVRETVSPRVSHAAPTVEPRETEVMRERWPEFLAHDPYYNPNLARERADFSLGD